MSTDGGRHQTLVVPALQAPQDVWNLLFAGWRADQRQAEIQRLKSSASAATTPESASSHFVAFVPATPQSESAAMAAPLRAALVFTRLPNRTAIIGLLRAADGESPELAHELLLAALQSPPLRGVAMAQTLLDPVDPVSSRAFTRAGFESYAQVVYLACPEQSLSSPPAVTLQFTSLEAMGEDGWRRLVEVVDRSYVDSLDCPRLNGLLPTTEVLRGYQHSGDFLPHAWLVARNASADVGGLIVTRHGDSGIWELAYMGLAAEARGQGLGGELVRHAKRLAAEGGASQLIVAVDSANLPAVSLYVAHGFVEFDRKAAWVRSL